MRRAATMWSCRSVITSRSVAILIQERSSLREGLKLILRRPHDSPHTSPCQHIGNRGVFLQQVKHLNRAQQTKPILYNINDSVAYMKGHARALQLLHTWRFLCRNLTKFKLFSLCSLTPQNHIIGCLSWDRFEVVILYCFIATTLQIAPLNEF